MTANAFHASWPVTVIIPAYNAEAYLAAAVASVLAQTEPGIECIVVDDGSSDGTTAVAESFGERIRLVRHPENRGRSAARNTGIEASRGEFLAFLDADDLLFPEKIAEQLEFLRANPGYDAAYSLVRYFRDGEAGEPYAVRRPAPSGDILPLLAYTNFITMHSPLIRRQAVARIGGFDVKLARYEDWDFFLRLSLAGSRFGFQERVHALVRLHGGNTVGDRARMFEAKMAVAERIATAHAEELFARGVDPAAMAAFHRADFGRVLILHGETVRGRMLIGEACRVPFPHRWLFRCYRAAAGLLGPDALRRLQEGLDAVVKYRKGRP